MHVLYTSLTLRGEVWFDGTLRAQCPHYSLRRRHMDLGEISEPLQKRMRQVQIRARVTSCQKSAFNVRTGNKKSSTEDLLSRTDLATAIRRGITTSLVATIR